MKKKWETNKIYRIVGYSEVLGEKIIRRMLEFGFTLNEKFVISHKSLTGKSVIVELRGYSLSMRTKFLKCLKVIA